MDAATAKVYEEFFVPALFGEWGERLAEAVELRDGDRVLDVACGTGAFARAAAARVGPKGHVTGLDSSRGMLAVAGEVAPGITWRLGSAESIPFGDASFEAVGSQFGLMFFADRIAAVREMMRVLAPRGRLAVAVWDSIENTPGYLELVSILDHLFGAEAADALRAPFSLGDPSILAGLFESADVPGVKITTKMGHARFASIRDWMHTEVRGWTLGAAFGDREFSKLLAEAQERLGGYVVAGGAVEFPIPAHIATATKA